MRFYEIKSIGAGLLRGDNKCTDADEVGGAVAQS